MSIEFRQDTIALTDADKRIVDEGKVPVEREVFDMLMSALKLQVDPVHGETTSRFEDVPDQPRDEHGKPMTASGKPKQVHISSHVHVSKTDKAMDSPHAGWHYMNDVYISVIEYERKRVLGDDPIHDQEPPVSPPPPTPKRTMKMERPLKTKKIKLGGK